MMSYGEPRLNKTINCVQLIKIILVFSVKFKLKSRCYLKLFTYFVINHY